MCDMQNGKKYYSFLVNNAFCYQYFVNVLSVYNFYNTIMSALKRIPVSEPIWRELKEMKGAGQTYDDLLENMIERVKKARLEDDVKMWESRPDSEYVSLSEIED
jgi:predicted CopG family antitoxin